MSDYKYSIEAKNVNKVFYKKSRQVKALINFNIKIEVQKKSLRKEQSLSSFKI